jgi:hypothetical protein
MPNHSTDQPLVQHRDGVSQAQRRQAALAPDYIAVDERSLKDLLAFARQYAKELRYYNLHNSVEGDWSAFLSPDLNLDEVVTFLRDPDAAPPHKAQRFRQPHFVLFLTFLQLLRHAQQQMNTLTQRHLDFYYQQVLRMSKQLAVSDQVNVVIELAAGVDQTLLPAGTRVQAGTDSLGQDLFYQTNRALIANRAQVARLSSLYIDKQVTGIREAREFHTGPKNEKFIKMLEIALGDPKPGDPLPKYETGETVDYNFLLSRQRMINFVRTELFLKFFEFRELMRLKRQRDEGDADWAKINQFLEKVGRTRTRDANFRLNPRDPKDFDANLITALGGAPNFGGITEVNTIYDLYEEHNRRRQDVQQFIRERLFFTDINDFDEMMRIKVRIIDRAWREINSLLEKAGRAKKGSAYTPPQPSASPAFPENLDAAVGPLNFAVLGVRNIDDYYVAFLRVEKFFFMSAENFAYIMEVAEKTDATPQEWDRVYAIMAEAYQGKVYAARRAELKKVREANGVDAMLRFALGDTSTEAGEAPPLERLKAFVRRDVDWKTLTNAIRDQEWDEVYRIVEIAQRNRENFPQPVAQKEEWRNLYPFADATTVGVTLSIEQETDTSRWKTFGRVPLTVDTDTPPLPSFGWALCSPLLSLSQGMRTVTLTLGFASEQFDDQAIASVLALDPFQVQLSTEKGWVEPDVVTLKSGSYAALSRVTDPPAASLKALQVEMTLNEQADPITPLPVDAGSLHAPWPILRLLLRQIRQPEGRSADKGQYRTHYQPFKDLVLVRTQVKVKVTGLTELQIENDETVLDPARPFEPFGTAPSIGSRFLIGHSELVAKKLDSLTFQLEWMGAPEKLGEHYRNYGAENVKDNTSFTVKVNLVDKRLPVPLANQARLFPEANASAPHTITLANVPATVQTGRRGYVYEREPNLVMGEDLRTWSRYLQWELNAPDFQHTAYPTVVTKKSIDLAAAITNRKASDDPLKSELYQVNPPYTPKIKSLSVDYTSSTEVVLATYQAGAEIDQLFHIQPFGYDELQPEPQTSRYCFLPQYDNEGELYIGVRDVYPPQNLAVLFQLAEGSADPDLEPVAVQWSYLSNNRWISLENGNILLDTTRGLINTGIIEFSLPSAQPNTLLAPELYWIRAVIAHHSNSVCDTVSIHTNAVSALFVDQNNAPDHLSKPLPAGTITQLVEPLPEISAIHQPYTSYGGKMAEQDSHLYMRVSERLRHKHRALTVWDYEHLILQQFPQIYKVKCLPVDLQAHPDEPGRVEIIVIPDIKNKLPFNPFEPKAPADLLADIATYLSDKAPSFATVTVRNAYYVPVKVRFAVRFLPGSNEGFYKQRLNEEIIRFLSPWAYEGDADIVIGGRIYANTLINFIEERPYVDYVAEVKLFTSEDRRTFRLAVASPDKGYYATTERPDGVLVTVRQHEIDMITEAGYEAETFRGINYMKIELDFTVGGN